MPDIRERPKDGKLKAPLNGGRPKVPGLSKQAGRMMREKYLRQLDQRPEGRESVSEDPVEQVETVGSWAGEELTAHIPTPHKRTGRETVGTRAQEPATPPTGRGGPGERLAVPPRERSANVRARSEDAPRPAPPKERQAVEQGRKLTMKKAHIKERLRTEKTILSDSGPALPRQSSEQFFRDTGWCDPATHPASSPGMDSQSPQRPRRQTISHSGLPRAQGGVESAAGRGRAHAAGIKERAAGKAVSKARTVSGPGGKKAISPKVRQGAVSLRRSARTAQHAAKQRAVRQTAAKSKQAAKGVLQLGRKLGAVAVKAVASVVGAIAGFISGGALLLALTIIVLIAAVASSPFGLFFAGERTAPDTVSVSEAVSQVNTAYNDKLEQLQTGGYDSIQITGQAPDWADVLAVFASRTAGAENGVDVATLDADRVDRLKAVFWDMTEITSWVERIEHPGDGDDEGWTECILHISIAARTADDMRAAYAFTSHQNSALDELLADRATLSALAGSLTITNADARAMLDALSDDLSPERKAVVETALKLYGKVNYFWGGKSLVLGWDSRWGHLKKVTAAGSATTGTYRPYGLDCSGFVDWAFYNATGGDYIIGHGGGAHAQHTYCTDITWAESQPGDLAFYPEDEHVGIVCGRDESGAPLIVHCASSANNVVITGTSGFTAVARPNYF